MCGDLRHGPGMAGGTGGTTRCSCHEKLQLLHLLICPKTFDFEMNNIEQLTVDDNLMAECSDHVVSVLSLSEPWAVY